MEFGVGIAGIIDEAGSVEEEEIPFETEVSLHWPCEDGTLSSRLITGTCPRGETAVAFGVVCGDSASETVLSEIVVLSAS